MYKDKHLRISIIREDIASHKRSIKRNIEQIKLIQEEIANLEHELTSLGGYENEDSKRS